MTPLPLVPLIALSTAAFSSPDPELTRSHGPRLFEPVFASIDGTQWVRGLTYKASVSTEGMRYIPFLGSEVSRNFPVGFRLTADEHAHASVERARNRVTISRPGVRVHYDFRASSVEQSFEFEGLPLDRHLVVDLTIDTELECSWASNGLRFEGPQGGMNYGSAVAISPSGGRIDLPMRWEDGHLRLVVPAAFVAEAHGQVIVDPLLSTFTVSSPTSEPRQLDAAYDAATDSFAYSYEVPFSGSDTDVYVSRTTASGVDLGGVFIDMTDEDWTAPAIAGLARNGSFLVVAEREASSGGTEIVGRLADAATAALSPPIVIDAVSPGHISLEPDVGGSFHPAPAAGYMVCWRREFSSGSAGLFARPIAGDGSQGALLALDAAPTNTVYEAEVSKSAGDPGAVDRWTVAYAVQNQALGGQRELRIAQVSGAGSLITPPATLDSVSPNASLGSIDVSDALLLPGIQPTYAVAYSTAAASAPTEVVLVARGANLKRKNFLRQSESRALFTNLRSGPSLSTTSNDFVVAYHERRPSESTSQARTTTFDVTFDGDLCITERALILGATGTGTPTGKPVLVSKFSGGATADPTVAAAWVQDNMPMGQQFIAAATIAADRPYSQGSQYCLGFINSTDDVGFIQLEGGTSTTAFKTLRASDLPFNAFGYFIVGDSPASFVFASGGLRKLCIGGALGRYSNFIQSSGTSGTISLVIDPQVIPQPTSTVAALPGDTWHFQLWHRDFVAGTVVSNFTNGVALQFD